MIAALVGLLLAFGAAPMCLGLGLSSGSVVVRPFGPTGLWSGHFGIDLLAVEGSPVLAVGDGTVSFVGSVAGQISVTIAHGGMVRTSYSYLGSATVVGGQAVVKGESVGIAGSHGGVGAFHLSLRIGSLYVDPVASLRCEGAPGKGLSLAGARTIYAVRRVRNPWRYIRSSSRGPPRGRTHRL